MTTITNQQINTLKQLGLKEYHAKTLAHLIKLGETKAPELSQASNVPKARIYEVLNQLANQGLIEKKPGRPAKYLPKPPEEIIDRIIHNRKTELEKQIEEIKETGESFKDEFQPLYESETKETPETLLKTVSVGEPSERETELMYKNAEEEIDISTKSMEWLSTVKKSLKDAIDKNVQVRVLFLSQELLEEENIPIQNESIKTLKEEFPEVEVKFSEFLLPLRGSIIDPSYDYTSGKALFLVEEKDIPLILREAAVTENPSLVAGMKRYFDLIWKHESFEIEKNKQQN